MRKSIMSAIPVSGSPTSLKPLSWLDIEQLATVEITSEDPHFPIENALGGAEANGWRAACKGPQFIRLNFDQPTPIHRIQLRFVDPSSERSQEFSIHAKSGEDDTMREVVRQQFTFSPGGATEEREDFSVDLHGVTRLELLIDPDRAHDPAHSTSYAVLQSLRIA